jgi:signal transduction histidine kinase
MGSHYISQLNDGRLLLSSLFEGLYLLNTSGASLNKVQLEDKYKKPFTTTFQDSKGRLFAVFNDEKILVLQEVSGRFKAITEIPVSGEVNAFLEIPSEKSIWIASSMGLIQLNSDDLSKFTVYNEKDGLANPYVHHVLLDRNGILWLSTNNGISSYDRKRHQFRNYSLADGVAGYEFISGSGLYDAENDLILLGGTEGANYFHPGSLTNLPLKPIIQITGLRYNDKVPMRGFSTEVRKAVFPYSQNTITFDFVSIDYADPANNKVAYRLKGYDNHWDTLTAPNGSARYAQLREGKYTFEVIGANSDGVWNPEPRRIEVEILPPFYRTWWFYLLEALALAGLIGGGVKIYVDKQLREERTKQDKLLALQKERDRIASEMHDDVGAGLTAIRLMSDRIQRQVQDNKLSQQINRIAVQAGDLVENMSSIIWAMNSSNDTYEGLFLYMRRYALEYLTETHDMSASFPMTEAYPPLPISGERRRQIFLAFKESLHNIVKHAGAASVAIRVTFDADKMEIRVADDGKGIPDERRNGNGLINMSKRMENIGGHFYMEPNTPSGTIIRFEIPITL